MMDKKIEQLYQKRLERFIERITSKIAADNILLDANHWHTVEPVSFDNRLKGEYKQIKEGDSWGKKWEYSWFHLCCDTPNDWNSNDLVLHLDFGGEGLVYLDDGKILQGISNGSVFDYDFNRDFVHIKNIEHSGKINLWVNAVASSLFGMFTESDPADDSPKRFGEYKPTVNKMRLCRFDYDHWHLWLDLRILAGLVKTLPEKSVRRSRIIDNINQAIDIYTNNNNSVTKCRAHLTIELDKKAEHSALNVVAVGHAHIDTAWLWPVSETIEKCARTFASQIKLIKENPEFIFGASQPQHYQFVKDHYPSLYEEIKEAVATGQWEVQGGMWVEADCNLISGESMVRQILYGKKFFKDEFNIEVDNLWLPDVFGYSANLPQILQKSGIKYFLTQKISWNQFNDFPHHTFLWRGIDGSEVLSHFPPENTYNSQLGTDYLVPAVENFKEKHFIDSFISLFGVGDGGGGPKEENIELGKRMSDLESSPRLKFGTAKQFFESLENYRDKLPKWVGELYLELHRGTLTTQAANKKDNRELEQNLRNLEMLLTMLPTDQYPQNELEQIWKTTLLNQFHDIIPGSSINQVYKITNEEYKKCFDQLEIIKTKAGQQLFDQDRDSITFFNALNQEYQGVVELTDEIILTDKNGRDLPAQKANNNIVAEVILPPLSYTTFNKVNKVIPELVPSDDLILENRFVCYKFNKNGHLLSAFDKVNEIEFIDGNKKGNLLSLYDDHPNDWDAWDIDIFYEKALLAIAKPIEKIKCFKGAVQHILKIIYIVGQSEIVQEIKLGNNSMRLDFETVVNWHEKHKMLRVSFPTTINVDTASYDIQFGFVKRPTHRNTSWDLARFEVVGHKYADLSYPDRGVALLNNCKYGYKVLDNVIDLNLLRSPTYPDPDADQGEHRFTYSLLPHSGDLINSNVMAEADQLNNPIFVFDGYKSNQQFPITLNGDGIKLETVKKAEECDDIIIRLYETKGKHTFCGLSLNFSNFKLVETNLIEQGEQLVSKKALIELTFKPFEIRTFKIKRG